MIRRFQVHADRVLTLPQGLKAGPGATNMRLDSAQIVELDEDDQGFKEHQRFIACSVRNGDLAELEPIAKPSPEAPASSPSTSPPIVADAAKPFTINPPASKK